jgi:hypothetical protein
MLEWYDLRLIDLYPDDPKWPTHSTPPPGVIGERIDGVADEACLSEEGPITSNGTNPGAAATTAPPPSAFLTKLGR